MSEIIYKEDIDINGGFNIDNYRGKFPGYELKKWSTGAPAEPRDDIAMVFVGHYVEE